MIDQFKAIVINQTENNFTREVKSLKKVSPKVEIF